jgi:predicted GH43/DUF377 family glycosyl hydrolase
MMGKDQHSTPWTLAAAAGAALIILTAAQATAGLVGHWQFDNPADVGQATVSSHLETVGDAAYSSSGRIGGALALDGTGDYLRVDATHALASGLPTGDASFTIAAFVQTSADARNTIAFWGNFSSAQANGFRTTTAGEFGSTGGLLDFGWGGGPDYGVGAGGSPPGTIYDGQWHHAAVTYDAATSTKRLYFDGVEIGTGKVISDLNVAAANFGIGSRTGSEPFTGLLDDVRVYDNALSEAELSALASAGGGPDTTAPTLAGTDPADGATEVGVSANLVIGFHELIAPGTGDITLKRASDNSTVETFDVTSSTQLTFAGGTVTIDPTSDLVGGVGYYVLIDPDAIEDASGNGFVGISDTTSWAFTTVPPFGPLIVRQDNGNLVFEWPSREDKVYNLLSSTDLSGVPATWSAYSDGSTTHANIPNSGTGTNTLTVPMPADPRRFFAVSQYPAEMDAETLAAWSAPYRNWHYQPDHVIPSNPNITGYNISLTDVPTVFQIPGDPKWYMTFVGFDGGGYQSFIAESTDLVNWTNRRLAMPYGPAGAFDYGGVVLGAYLYESYDIKAPRTLKLKDGKYWSLYGAYNLRDGYEAGVGSNGLASSIDGVNWSRTQNDPVVSIYDDDTGAWESNMIYQPWLIEHEGTYYSLYNAKGGPEQIGAVTSSDLLTWARYENNPVIPVGASPYNTAFSADPKIFWDRDHWVCFFFGVGGGAHIMAAFSRDLYDWTVDPNPLYLAGGNPSGLDSTYAHKISLVWNPANETYYMYYCAVGNQGRGIGLITSKPLDGK